MSGDRQQLIQSAIGFLRDPSAASSPLAQRVAFLESKGLSPVEIEHCLSAANNAGPAGSYGPGGQRITREFERDWRDWFIMGVVGGAVGWLAFKLVNKYIAPHLQPPSDTELAAAQKALEAKYDEAAGLIKELSQGTAALTELVESQKKDVERDLEDLRAAVKDLREGEKKREEWTAKVSSQVDEITRSLPALLDKTASSQAQALQDLQGELKSLKSLVITRRQPSTSTSPTPAAAPSSTSGATSASGTSGLPFGNRPVGLPSWQLNSTGAGLATSTSAPALNTTLNAPDESSQTPATSSTEGNDSTVLVDKDATEK